MDPFATAGKPPPGRPDEAGAREIALQALAFLATDEGRTERFLALTGAEPGEIRTLARDPGFLAGVLDFLLAEDAPLLAFCEEAELRPETVHAARHILAPTDEAY